MALASLLAINARRHDRNSFLVHTGSIRLFDHLEIRQFQHESIGCAHWRLDSTYLLVTAQAFVGQFVASLKDYSPRQKPESFSIDQVLESLQRNQGG